MVGVEIPTIDFFARYGNVYNADSKFLVACDSNANYVATPRTQFLGKNYFGNDVQKFFDYNAIQNEYYRKVFAGQLLGGYAIYDFGSGERLNTGYPIFVQGKPTYFVFIVTPTASLYSNVNEVLLIERLKMFSLIAGTTAAVLVLILFLIKWNNALNNEVKRRTKEVEESNKQLALSNQQLALANEQLRVHDKMQREFINVASHEMRTPTQAIVGFSELLQRHPERNDEMIQAIQRNAARLQKLTNDILDVSRIESQSLKLDKEQFNLNDVIVNCINDAKINNYLFICYCYNYFNTQKIKFDKEDRYGNEYPYVELLTLEDDAPPLEQRKKRSAQLVYLVHCPFCGYQFHAESGEQKLYKHNQFWCR
jgi:signal transduction histidine kinase